MHRERIKALENVEEEDGPLRLDARRGLLDFNRVFMLDLVAKVAGYDLEESGTEGIDEVLFQLCMRLEQLRIRAYGNLIVHEALRDDANELSDLWGFATNMDRAAANGL